MKIVMNMLVRDEEDILEYTILHYLDLGVDSINIMNHLSIDKTNEIIEHYAAKGVVTEYKQTSDRYDQSEWMTFLGQEAYKKGADWVIYADADEFLYCKKPLRDILAECNAYDTIKIKYQDSIHPIDTDFKGSNHFHRHDRFKIITKGRSDVLVDMGNHSCNMKNGLNNINQLRYESDMVIYHYPHRSREQCYRKMVIGGEAINKSFPTKTNIGGHWREVHTAYHTNRPKYDEMISDKFNVDKYHPIVIDYTMIPILDDLKYRIKL